MNKLSTTLYFWFHLWNIPGELANLAQVHWDQTDAGDR